MKNRGFHVKGEEEEEEEEEEDGEEDGEEGEEGEEEEGEEEGVVERREKITVSQINEGIHCGEGRTERERGGRDME